MEQSDLLVRRIKDGTVIDHINEDVVVGLCQTRPHPMLMYCSEALGTHRVGGAQWLGQV